MDERLMKLNYTLESNVREACKEAIEGGHPRLTYNKQSIVIARNRAAKMTFVGGLGAFGVGMMWRAEEDCDSMLGFADAPEMEFKP